MGTPSIPFRFSRVALASATAAGLVVGGCATETVDSSDIRTAGMHPIYSALSTGDGKTTVTGELRVGGDNGTFVVLVAGDELTASAGDEEKAMKAIDDGLRYETSFAVDAAGTLVNVALSRGDSADGNTNGPKSQVEIPQPFTLSLSKLKAGSSIPRGGDVAIEWDPAGSGEVSWELDGDCVFYSWGSTEDDGAFSIPSDEIDTAGIDEGETCEVTITVERVQRGSVDPIFAKEGGTIRATQQRTVAFESSPGPSE